MPYTYTEHVLFEPLENLAENRWRLCGFGDKPIGICYQGKE